MGWIQSLERFLMLLDGLPSKHHLSSDAFKILGESTKLILDLIGKLSCMTENEGRDRLRVFWQLVKNCQNKHCSLSHTRLSLAEHIHSNHCLWDAFLLNFRGVLETAISDGSLKLRFEKEILKAGSTHRGVLQDPKYQGSITMEGVPTFRPVFCHQFVHWPYLLHALLHIHSQGD